MSKQVNSNALFLGSCLALITTGLTFSIRAGILPQLGASFNLSAEQLGFINSMWFLGFPISMILGGLFYYKIGPANIMRIAFVSHTLGIILTIFATGYTSLLVSTLFIGFGNGCTEAACNPLIADLYSGKRMDKMLNRFHMWFPGGIVLGSLISKFMTDFGASWQTQMWIIMVPTILYAIIFWGKAFPEAKQEAAASISNNFKAMFSPIFIFLFCCMALTAISEFGPQQWVGIIMADSGASPMLILALVTGVMAVGRFFAGSVIKVLGQTGVLLFSAVFATIGVYLFSVVTGGMAYVAAIFFAVGVCYFWPTMIATTAQRVPLSGALGMSIIGGVGMFSTSIFQPIIGRWIDKSKETVVATGQTVENIDLAVGQATLAKLAIFPAILIVVFLFFYIWQKRTYKPEVHPEDSPVETA
ncbi:MFS transporter [Sphingobacterium sp. DK4209]|uniref:MFS transporter n=1 Tax=Sphingobacterium zhuxiongii TaxID=2662364 RepID=A0A5Q0QHD0_9SPHI|nr:MULTISPECIES: MFS transporter [unclassified Sphingobacterium]MVZ66628.1 MFS transporter [Sphingobacterium sp. DK4209]QGA26810.1 MFS transporter [Sphingobacterium sp. dk4302]